MSGRGGWERFEPVSVDGCTCLRETDKALLIEAEGSEFWVPKSQVHDDSEVFDAGKHATGVLVIPRWLAEEKGLA